MPNKTVAPERKERILDAFMECIQDHSISETSIRMIAQRAGLTPSLLHYYFKDKTDIISQFVERTLTLRDSKEMASSDDPFQDFKANYAEVNRLSFQDEKSDQYVKAYCQIYATASADSTIQEAVVKTYSNLLDGYKKMLLPVVQDEKRAVRLAFLFQGAIDGMIVLSSLMGLSGEEALACLDELFNIPGDEKDMQRDNAQE